MLNVKLLVHHMTGRSSFVKIEPVIWVLFCACHLFNEVTGLYSTRAENSTLKGLFGTLHSLLFQILFLLPDQRLYTVNNKSIHTHISDCTQTVYELPFLPNNTAVKHFYTNLKRCEMLTEHL